MREQAPEAFELEVRDIFAHSILDTHPRYSRVRQLKAIMPMASHPHPDYRDSTCTHGKRR